MSHHLSRLRRISRLSAALTIATVILGCQADRLSDPGPSGPPTIELQGQTFLFDIDLETGTIRVSHPKPAAGPPASGPSYSILNDDAVGVTTSNVVLLPPGAPAPPEKRRIRFDVALTNKLSVTDLVTPTFPKPPIGVNGIIFFPFSVAVTGPNGGSGTPSADWDGDHSTGSGSPFNFFNDFTACVAAASDCYRWESFPSPLAGGHTTTATTVGFDVPAHATSVQAYIVIAADLLDHPPLPQSGAIQGHVTSPQAGALQGVTVGASGQASTTTDITGGFQFTGVPIGATTLSLSNLPAGCTDPGTQSSTVVTGGIAVVNFSVTCPPPSPTTGTVAGTVTSSLLGNLYGVTIVANPGSKGAATDGSGSFSIPGLPAGAVVLTISNLPTGCVNPGSLGVTVTAGGAVGANFSVSCTGGGGGGGGGGSSGALTGVVSANGFGVASATVALNPGNLTTTTDAQGIFGFTNVPVGTALVTVTSPLVQGCQSLGTQAVSIVGGQSAALTLSATCAPVHIVVQAGNGQTAGDGTLLPVAPAVLVTDGYNHPVSGVSVSFAVTAGGGSVSGPVGFTDLAGNAHVGSWRLGVLVGGIRSAQNTLEATAGPTGNQATITATAIGNFWTTRAPMPTAREGVAAGVINGILYAADGSPDNGSSSLGTLEAYNPANNTWNAVTPSPALTPRIGPAAQVINGVMYIVGGNDQGQPLDILEAYDPGTNTVTTKAPMPTARAGLGVGVVNGVLYAVGGQTSSGIVATVEAYDPTTNTWTPRAPMPTPRALHAVAVLNGVLYAIGGISGTNPVATVEAYDPQTDSWTTRSSLPTVTYGLTANGLNGLVYAAGGFVPQGSSGSGTAAVLAYDPALDTWTARAAMSAPRAGMASVVINGLLYEVGGVSDLSVNPVATIEAYQP